MNYSQVTDRVNTPQRADFTLFSPQKEVTKQFFLEVKVTSHLHAQKQHLFTYKHKEANYPTVVRTNYLRQVIPAYCTTHGQCFLPFFTFLVPSVQFNEADRHSLHLSGLFYITMKTVCKQFCDHTIFLSGSISLKICQRSSKDWVVQKHIFKSLKKE